MVVAGLVLFAVIAEPSGPALLVNGHTACPSAGEVDAALAGLIEPKEPEAGPDVATLSDDGNAVVVTLRRASGEAIGEKRLDAGLSCAERARAAAVIIAAWEPRLATQTTTLVVQERDTSPDDAAPPRASAVVTRAEPDPDAPSGPLRIEPGVGVGASMNGTNIAPAATIEVALSRPGGVIVPAVAALAVGSHTMPLDVGEGRWRRYGLLATVGARQTWSAAWIEGRIGVAFTQLDIAGSRFPSNGAGTKFDPGFPGGVRLGLQSRMVRWWIDGTVAYWPRSQAMTVLNTTASTTLPRAEVLLSLGASYGGP